MGLSPSMAIYQARFTRYLENRGLKPKTDAKVWAFLGDGETDEPETLGAITLASRENLDNLIFVMNCNLQRLDGPVRGNGKIIQELESRVPRRGLERASRCCGAASGIPFWSATPKGCSSSAWASAWTASTRNSVVESGGYVRKQFFGNDPRLLKLVEHMSRRGAAKLRHGGHDPRESVCGVSRRRRTQRVSRR